MINFNFYLKNYILIKNLYFIIVKIVEKFLKNRIQSDKIKKIFLFEFYNNNFLKI
jgi:hypothetical protein